MMLTKALRRPAFVALNRSSISSSSSSSLLSSVLFQRFSTSNSNAVIVESVGSPSHLKKSKRMKLMEREIMAGVENKIKLKSRTQRLNALHEVKYFKPFKAVIIGRPNVGKSSLFNRLVKRQEAIVSPIPGTTRDRREGLCQLGAMSFTVVDTGGLDLTKDDLGINASMLVQTEYALEEADVILFCIDAREGITAADLFFAQWLRRRRKLLVRSRKQESKDPSAKVSDFDVPIVLLANKAEGFGTFVEQENELNPEWNRVRKECLKLGFGEPVPISASHGSGLGDVYHSLEPFALLSKEEASVQNEATVKPIPITMDRNQSVESLLPSSLHNLVRIAIVGRPNVGKSSLLNAIVGDKRVITGPKPGLTRDAISVKWETDGRKVELIDTAGMRKQGKLYQQAKKSVHSLLESTEAANVGDVESLSKLLEGLSVESSIRALNFSHVVIVVIDFMVAEDGSSNELTAALPSQDIAILGKAVSEGRGVVVVANKIDRIGVMPSARSVRKVQGQVPDEVVNRKPVPIQNSNLEQLKQSLSAQISESIPLAQGIPIVLTSAENGLGVDRIMPSVFATYDKWTSRIPTSKLVRWLQIVTRDTPPPKITLVKKSSHGGRQEETQRKPSMHAYRNKETVRIKYITQVSTGPPTFAVFTNRNDSSRALGESYQRFLLNRLKQDFNLEGVVVRLLVRGSKNPFVKRHRQNPPRKNDENLSESKSKV